MEYLIVKFVTERTVYVDGASVGTTNTVIAVDPGVHEIHIGEPVDYMPSRVKVHVSGTTAKVPQQINLEVGAGPGQPGAVR